ncbi:nuclear transport factor 2 family protein [Pedobacter sp. Du54]|uniref:nuclear transport factor 2 family protein n=1 Tax=Pedobacter anseongensis TaxID=3133439 RepID=UPI0030B1BE2C
MKKIVYTLFAWSIGFSGYAQKSDGSAKSLAAAELAFSASALKNGTNAAFTSFAAPDAVVFRPNAVNARKFYSTAPDMKNLSWKPSYTRMSRSRDWGFTTGAYMVDGEQKSYGQYVSVWRGNNGNWELILDMGAESNKPLKQVVPTVIEPKDKFSPVFATEKDLKTKRDIIYTTEKILNTTLKTYGPTAFSGFLSANSRLLFPGTEPVLGKENIQAFNNRMIDKINLKTVAADKALGGDLAYSYGVATIDYKTDLRESFNYLYIWELQPDFTWNILVQIYTLAER